MKQVAHAIELWLVVKKNKIYLLGSRRKVTKQTTAAETCSLGNTLKEWDLLGKVVNSIYSNIVSVLHSHLELKSRH